MLTAIPMLIIANAYRRLNLPNANCGASFEWVGRAISPYLGLMPGWLVATGSLISGIVLAPSVLAIFGNSNSTNKLHNVLSSFAVIMVMAAIAIICIKVTVRTQVSMALVEYVILIGFAIAGPISVIGPHPETFAISGAGSA